MSFFSSFKIFTGMLCGPGDLCESREYIIKDILFLSVGIKKKVQVFKYKTTGFSVIVYQRLLPFET